MTIKRRQFLKRVGAAGFAAPVASMQLLIVMSQPWLGFSFIYTYRPEKPNDWVAGKPQVHVYEAALREYQKSDVMPFVLGESQMLVACLPELQSVTVDFDFLNGCVFTVSFIDPRSGQPIKSETQKEKKVRRIPSPPVEDRVLMVRSLEPRM